MMLFFLLWKMMMMLDDRYSFSVLHGQPCSSLRSGSEYLASGSGYLA